jgi:hypothetical protein
MIMKWFQSLPIITGITLECLLRDAQLRSGRQNIVDGRVVSSGVVRMRISQKALETLPEDGNVMSKHVGATIHN